MNETDNMEKLLELKNIRKSYSGVEVLKGVSADLHSGEVLCFVGENGAGKSTLIKIISGVTQADSGTVSYFGQTYPSVNPRQVMDLGLATIYQDIDLVDTLTVADNIFLGSEIRGPLRMIRAKTQIEEANALLDRMQLKDIRGNMLLETLSTAQKQCVQIAKALKNEARILILDEPTASLGDKETRVLLELVKKLASQGLGIIYISHYIEELFEIGDTLLILKDGSQVSLRKTKETKPEQVISDMIGREGSSYYSREYFPCGERTLEVQHYTNKSTVHDVSFTLCSGEVFGLGGLVGAGRTELVRMIYGADPKFSGRLLLDGRDITPASPKDAIRKGIYMISEDRKAEGLLPDRSVSENIMITHNESKEWISLDKERQDVEEAIGRFEIHGPGPNAVVTSLSGGNQQKAIIARCVTDPGEIYIFDEPTKGVDVGAKEEIYGHILDLARQDKFILLISSDMPELLSMSDRIGVMHEGVLTSVVVAEKTSENDLMRAYLGLEPDPKESPESQKTEKPQEPQKTQDTGKE